MSLNLVPGLVTTPIVESSEEVSLPAPRPSPELPEGAKAHDVIIVGSGPVGYTATIYMTRMGLNPPVLVGAINAGGALMNTTEVENFSGLPEGIQGLEFMDKMQEQAEKFGAEIRYEDVTAVNFSKDVKVLALDDKFLHARSMTLTIGSKYRHMNVGGEDRPSRRGVSYCATYDGFSFKNKILAVIGRGDSAMEKTSFLTSFTSKVIVVYRRDALHASKSMTDRAMMNPKTESEWDAVVDEVLGDEAARGLRLRSTVDESTRETGVDDVFVAIGHLSCTGFLAEDTALNEAGYITVEEPSTRASVEGVFACSDATDHSHRQAITATGSDCCVALDAECWLAALND